MYIAIITRPNKETHSIFQTAHHAAAFGLRRMKQDNSITSVEVMDGSTAEIKYTLVRGE